MGVYIKGMDMPKKGDTVTITICGDGLVFEEWKEPGSVFKAVPVPPHGRLIDGDIAEVISFEEADAEGKDFADGVLYAADFISQMPTIIPAEEEKT